MWNIASRPEEQVGNLWPFYVPTIANFNAENQQEEANYMEEQFNCYGLVYLEWTFF